MKFFIVYTTTIVLCWNVGTTTSAQLGKFQPAPLTLLTSPATVTSNVDKTAIVFCSESCGIVQWYGPDGGVVPSRGNVRQSGTSSSRQLVFASYQSSQGGQYQCRTSKDGTTSTLYVTFAAVSSDGQGAYNDIRQKRSYNVPSKVGPPTLTKAARSGRPALTVTWTAPQSDRPITKYQVWYRRIGTTILISKDVTSTSTTLENLSAGASYQVLVKAVSDVGVGHYSDLITQITYQVPAKVSGVTLTKAVRSGRPALIVRWTRHNINERVTGYQVQYRRGTTGEWREKRVSSVLTSTYLENLDIGTIYQVRVNALSDIGDGPVGDIRVHATYRAPPAPSGVRVTPHPQRGVLRVTWRAPTVDTGLTITGYSVQYRTSSTGYYSRPRTVSGRSTSTTISGLQLGTRYRVRVAAVTQLGTGAYSSDAVGTTYKHPPAPSGVTVTPLPQRGVLGVTWRVPTVDTGLTITGYFVQYRTSSTGPYSRAGTVSGSSTSTTIPGLQLGTRYRVKVAAVTQLGIGMYSSDVGGTTYNVPNQVTGVQYTLDNNNNVLTMTVTWSRPSSDVVITHYEVQYSEDGRSQSTLRANTEQITITGTMGRSYRIRVRAVSAVGTGEQSKSITIGPPPPPSIISIISSTTALTARWDDGGYNYRLHVQKKGSTEIRMFGPVTPPYNITGLESNTEYTVILEAYSLAGNANGSKVAYTLPEVPKDLVLQVLSSTSIRVTWTPPPNADRLPLTYHVGYSSEFTIRMSTSTTELSLVLTGLHPFDEYTVTVEAENLAENSGPLYKSVRTWRTVPTAPPSAPRVNQIYPRSILLQWEPPPRRGRNGIITHYIVQIKKPSDRKKLNKTVDLKNPTFSDSTTITFNATGLTPYTTYMWRIAAVNHVGVGPFSTLSNVETAEDVPGSVKALSHRVLSNTSVRLMWNLPKEPNGIITGYEVVYGVYKEDNSTAVNVKRELTYTIDNLIPKVPFEVSVSAKTVAGTGKKQSKVLFTTERAPTVKVQNVVTKWINYNSAVLVSWTPLTLYEARGFPLYVVTYWPSSLNRVSRDINSVTTTDSSVVIGGLDPTTSYSITVDVYTGNGTIKGSVTAEMNIVNPPVKPSTDNTGGIAGSVVSFLVVITLILVITITTVVYCKRKHKIRENAEIKEDNAKNECLQLEDNPAYGEVNIYEEIQ